jgi:hypothetical protein
MFLRHEPISLIFLKNDERPTVFSQLLGLRVTSGASMNY